MKLIQEVLEESNGQNEYAIHVKGLILRQKGTNTALAGLMHYLFTCYILACEIYSKCMGESENFASKSQETCKSH